MSDVRFEVTGTAFEVMRQAVYRAPKMLNEAVYAAAGKVLRTAKVNVKNKLNTTGKSKGTLARSITIAHNKGQFLARIGPSVIYGRIHEYGGWAGRGRTAYIPPRPYLQPALEAEKNDIEIIFQDKLKGLFD